MAEKRGLAVLADVAKMGLVFQHTGAATTRKYIREHQDTVRRYVKSHVEAVHKMWTDKEATIRAIGKHMPGVEREFLEKSYENVMSETLFSKKQYPKPGRLEDRSQRARRERPEGKERQARTIHRLKFYPGA